MQAWRSTSTMPSARLKEAPVGHTSTQGGSAQCWHITGTEAWRPVLISLISTLRIHCAEVGDGRGSSPFSVLQALTQSVQPLAHFVVSIRRPQRTMLLAPGNSEAVFFAGDAATFARYLLLGAQHILAGADHLLFLLTVVVAAAGWRYWLAVVTAFTVAHSITLALAAWGLVQAPAQVVEPLIAASVVLLALDNLLRRAPHLRQRLVLVFGCGLLHGLGIASVLSDAPIANHHMLASLAGFNLGVELGQMAFVAVVLALMQLARRLSPQVGALWLVRGGSAAAAVMRCFWFVQRVWF